MKILVLSDSHASLRLMRSFIRTVRPDAVIHLGDFYDDGRTIAEENPHIRFHQLPGNCDRFRAPQDMPPVMYYDVCGVRLYMTHGHLHNVKSSTARLLSDARKAQVQAVLYGHTHIPDCHQEPDGLWVLNPGSCGHGAGTAGVIETESNAISACYLISEAALEGML